METLQKEEKIVNTSTKLSASQKGLAPIAIVILITALVVGGYLFYSSQTKPTLTPRSTTQTTSPSSTPTVSPVPNGTGETANWKIYTEPENVFSIKYPNNWKLSLSNPISLQSSGKKDIKFSGPEGEFSIQWADNYGGGCDQGYEKLSLGGIAIDVCHTIEQIKESWTGIEKDLNPTSTHIGIYINATANAPIGKNRSIILEMFSTFRFD